MPDNVTLNAGTGGALVSTEEVTNLNGGAVTAQQVQRIVPAIRTADATAVDVTASAPMPMTLYGAGGVQAIVGAQGGLEVEGCLAHDAPEACNPIALGAFAVAHGASPAAVAASDRVRLVANVHGVPFVIGGHPNVVTYAHTAITTAVTDAALVTVSAGTRIVVTGLTVTLDNASTVFPSVRIGFGTSVVPALGNAGILLAHGGVPAGGGVARGSGDGIIGAGADDQDLRITTVGNATGNGLQVVVTYYTIQA